RNEPRQIALKMTAAPHEQRQQRNSLDALGCEAADGRFQIGLHVFEERNLSRDVPAPGMEFRNHSMKWLGPARIAGAVRKEQDSAGRRCVHGACLTARAAEPARTAAALAELFD